MEISGLSSGAASFMHSGMRFSSGSKDNDSGAHRRVAGREVRLQAEGGQVIPLAKGNAPHIPVRESMGQPPLAGGGFGSRIAGESQVDRKLAYLHGERRVLGDGAKDSQEGNFAMSNTDYRPVNLWV